LGSIQLNVFKGLVLRNLRIYGAEGDILSLKEASCTFLIWPIFKKAIILPTVRIDSPEVFLERRADNSWNLQDLFVREKTAPAQAGNFSFFVYSIKINNAAIHFQDNSLARPFRKNLSGLNLSLHLSLPASLKFNFASANIVGSGEYKIPAKELTAKIALLNLSPKEFSAYYESLGVNIPEGLIDANAEIRMSKGRISAEITGQNKELLITKNNFSARLNSDITGNLSYIPGEQPLRFSGQAKIFQSKLSGLPKVGVADNLSGELSFDNSGIATERLDALVWGLPVSCRISLKDFSNPALNVDLASTLNLTSLPAMLKDKFKVEFSGSMQGSGNLTLKIQAAKEVFQFSGQLDILEGKIKLEKLNLPFEDIRGKLNFDAEGLQWQELGFKYADTAYQSNGSLKDFKAPAVEAGLSSRDLTLETEFRLKNKLVHLSQCKGKYLNSDFSLAGDFNTEALPRLGANISGSISLNLEDLKPVLKKYQAAFERIRPQGVFRVDFNFSGDVNDFKACRLQAKCSSASISAYGFKAGDFTLDYNQAEGMAEIPSLRMSLYDGIVSAAAKMNLNSGNLPYWLQLDMQGVKIEKLKMDTAAKNKDISGLISGQAKLNGFSDDFSKLSGAGRILVSHGRLWELNLFQGLGAFLFASDYASIVFEEASCVFNVADKAISTDNLRMQSNITELNGPVKIGFDGSVDASLDVVILTESIPLKGTFKDVTTAIIGGAGRFGIIKISGTLKEPKFKFKPAVADIIKSIKNIFFEQ
ncbi:MAG: DUF3971 domain-containing protein, partial [Candidatus Omnitrophota bacterium]|nr:DUF3971 domain-containing protein [Candidatus Omnitrophota bacterium]